MLSTTTAAVVWYSCRKSSRGRRDGGDQGSHAGVRGSNQVFRFFIAKQTETPGVRPGRVLGVLAEILKTCPAQRPRRLCRCTERDREPKPMKTLKKPRNHFLLKILELQAVLCCLYYVCAVPPHLPAATPRLSTRQRSTAPRSGSGWTSWCMYALVHKHKVRGSVPNSQARAAADSSRPSGSGCPPTHPSKRLPQNQLL